MTATAHRLSPDTQAILLLSGSLGQERGRDARPLTPVEYHELAQLLRLHQFRPADLLDASCFARLRELEPLRFDSDRITTLLNRGAALGLAVETWTNRGLWVISRSDSAYPQRLRSRLGRSAPPILYGVGNQELLAAGGLAIVGSREIDDAAITFTRAIAQRCAYEQLPIISGGARGVDSEAMQAALDASGTVVGVLADSLTKAAVAGKYRAALRAGRLVLVTPYDPDAGFSVGNAMGRNKQIYVLSDYALVVSATLEQGGTWNGALENLAHQWAPLFVRATQPMLPGNQRLIERGGFAFADPQVAPELPLQDWMRQQTSPADDLPPDDAPEAVTPPHNPTPQPEAALAMSDSPENDLFTVVWPYLERELQHERTDREIADRCGIELVQARAWLHRAVEQRLVKKLSKPVRYIAVTQTARAETLPLFS